LNFKYTIGAIIIVLSLIFIFAKKSDEAQIKEILTELKEYSVQKIPSHPLDQVKLAKHMSSYFAPDFSFNYQYQQKNVQKIIPNDLLTQYFLSGLSFIQSHQFKFGEFEYHVVKIFEDSNQQMVVALSFDVLGQGKEFEFEQRGEFQITFRKVKNDWKISAFEPLTQD